METIEDCSNPDILLALVFCSCSAVYECLTLHSFCNVVFTSITYRCCSAIGLLPKLAIKIMERWYQQNIKHPYPSQETAESLALSGEIAPEQVSQLQFVDVISYSVIHYVIVKIHLKVVLCKVFNLFQQIWSNLGLDFS